MTHKTFRRASKPKEIAALAITSSSMGQNRYAVTTINIAGPNIGFEDVQYLWKRKGGGGAGGHGGSSSSGGHSSDGSSSDGGSTSGGKGSDSSSAGGRTTTGSGVTPNFGGGRFYGGGASVPYSSGARSPSGISPVLLAVAAASIFPGLWLYDVYSYPYSNLYTFHNESAKINQTKPVICLCQEYCECGCDENTNSTFMNDILGDGSYTTLNRSLVTVGIVNGTSTIIINGTLPNGTTASGGSVSANTGGSLRLGLSSSLGYLIVIGTVLAAVFV
jgi:hypothetical protein